jgi:hypothetical protein
MLTFIYSTYRATCLFDWFVDSLAREPEADPSMQIVCVDAMLLQEGAEARREEMEKAVAGRFQFVHVPPKPNPYQGPHRLTSKTYFSASNPRNSGIVLASHSYVCFIDDLSIMQAGSLRVILQAKKEGKVLGCAYKKVHNLARDGSMYDCTNGLDSRWNLAKEGQTFVKIEGSQLYGYSCMPLEAILEINGYDHIADSIGLEDSHAGHRLQKSGQAIWYSREACFLESEDYPSMSEGAVRRRGNKMSPQAYKDLLKKYGITRRWHADGPLFADHFLLDTMTLPTFRSIGNDFDLRAIRAGTASFPTSFNEEMRTLDNVLLRDL